MNPATATPATHDARPAHAVPPAGWKGATRLGWPVVAIVMALSWAALARAGVSDYTLIESPRGTFPSSTGEVKQILDTQVSPDGRHIATMEYSVVQGIKNLPNQVVATKGAYVRRDGEKGHLWAEIAKHSLSWSPNSKHILCVARDDDGWHAVVDDKAGPAFKEVSRAAFAGDEGHVIYSAQRDDSNFVIYDGHEFRGCAGAKWWWIDSSGNRIACVIPEGKRWQLAVDGTPSVTWDFVPYFGFTEPEGTHYFYVAHEGARQRIVFDTQPRQAYDAVGKLLCQDDGSCVAWIKTGDKWHVSRAGMLGPGYDEKWIWNKELLLSPDGQHVIYITGEKNGDNAAWTVHVDEKEYGPYDAFGTPVWGGDGAHWAITIGRGMKRAVVRDGVEGPSFDMVIATGPFFSPDGSHLGYFVQGGKTLSLMLDGQKVVTMDKIIGPLMSFSDDSKHWALTGKRGNAWHVVIDGEEAQTGFGDVRVPGPVFSKDGSLSFIARKGENIVCATYRLKGRK